jgi:hypothetical protein
LHAFVWYQRISHFNIFTAAVPIPVSYVAQC